MPTALQLVLLLVLALAQQPASEAAAITNKKLAGGYGFNCIQEDGSLFSWGHSSLLGLGNEEYANSPFPIQTPNVTHAVDVAGGGSHFCIVEQEGVLKCAGINYYGQLGRNVSTLITDKTLRPAVGLPLVATVFAAQYRTFALLHSGALYAFGSNAYNSLGIQNGGQNVHVPTLVEGFKSGGAAVMVAASLKHTCVVSTEGALHCVGYNDAGQLGMGTRTDLAMFTQVPGLEQIVQVACGEAHTCALASDGVVQCFGRNEHGQLGNGGTTRALSPVPVIGLPGGVVQIVAYGATTCVVHQNARDASCFGGNEYGQFANGALSRVNAKPTAFGLGISNIAELRLSNANSAILLTAAGGRTVHVSGYDNVGQIGDGKMENRLLLSQTLYLPITSNSTTRTEPPTPPHTSCVPQPVSTRERCIKLATKCRTMENRPMRWTGLGCKIKNRRVRDAGCRCADYCGFNCKRACLSIHNRAHCKWQNGRCINKQADTPQDVPAMLRCNIA